MIASLLLLVGLAHAVVVDRIAAVVNSDVITLSEVYALGGDFIEQRTFEDGGSDGARRAAELEVLDSLILRRLISQEVSRLEHDISDVELDRTIDDIAQRNGMTREQLQLEVERSGLPWTEYREELRESLRQARFTQAIIQPRITVDENELQDAYRRLVSGAERPQVVDLGAIFLLVDAADPDSVTTAAATAESAHARLAAGEAFASIAAELDQGPYAAEGGRMGTYRQGELLEAIDSVAFATEVGTLSAPIETPQGLFLLYVFDLSEEQPPEFDAVRDQLMEQVYADRIEEETDVWYQQTRRRSAVSIKLQDVE